MYQIYYTQKAMKFINSLDAHKRKLVASLIEKKLTERPHDFKCLKGVFGGKSRLRIGNLRAVYTINDTTKIVEIEKIEPRDKVYKLYFCF